MNRSVLKFDAFLLLAALIWGGGFVAQRAGMEHVGPFTFNGIRFALAVLALLPLILAREARKSARSGNGGTRDSVGDRADEPGSGAGRGTGAAGEPSFRGAASGRREPAAEPGPAAPMPRASGAPHSRRTAPWTAGGILAGTVLFAASSFQQVGIVSTTAGKAGFITGLYVVIVPILGLLLGQRAAAGTWAGAVLAAGGLYLLSVTGSFSMAPGDLLVLAGAFLWAGHVLVIGRFSPGADTLRLAAAQFALCSVASLAAAFFTEEASAAAMSAAALPIVYGGVFSVGVAFTLQVAGQRRAPPAHAAVLLSMEAVFAALGGWIILGETIPGRGMAGCGLMLLGMLVSQLGGQFSSIAGKNR